MKQSKKLLSLVLALVMAFSFVGVIGNAALVKSAVKYDSVDDAILSPEQVADMALDLIEPVLAGLGVDEEILGIKLCLNSVDETFSSLYGLRTALNLLGWMLGDLGKLDLDALGDGSNPWQRSSSGDLRMIYQLLQFLADNADTVKGFIGSGINLGSILGGFLDLSAVNRILIDPAALLVPLVYDMLIHGSYKAGATNDSFPASDEGTLDASVDTLDEIVKQAIGGLLKNPQDYSWEKDANGKDVKVWDKSAVLLPTIANNADWGVDVVAGYFDPYSQSFFTILDKLVPFAIKDLGVNALNHNLKKALMEAVEADINEIDVAELPSAVATDFEVNAEDGKESYCNYIAYDRLCKDGKVWYYTTIETETVMEGGEPVIDTETGEEKTQRVRKYFKVNMAAANEFADVINWDWNIKAEQNCLDASGGRTIPALSTVPIDTLDYQAMVHGAGGYGSLVESLNHIIYIVFENALTTEIKAEFAATTGKGWVDGSTSAYIMDNLERTVKFLLSKYGDKIFGSDSEFANMPYSSEYDDETGDMTVFGIEDMSLVELIAKIGPSFFGDAMPQLIMPRYTADTIDVNGNLHKAGDYAFTVNSDGENVQLFQFGALVLREFMTEIAPGVNYDSFIFEAGNVKSANDRQFADRTVDEWFDLILNMGMDIAYTYLYNLTDFGDSIVYDLSDLNNAATYGSLSSSSKLRTSITVPAAGDTEARWQDMLDTVIMWAADYVGQGGSGLLNGLSPDAIEAKSGPLNKLSFILNTLLPLNFINGCSSSSYAFDTEVLLGKAKELFTSFDLTQLSSLFGRPANSLLSTNNFIQQVLNLVNRILTLVIGANLLPDTSCLNNVLTEGNLKSVVGTLLTQLNARKADIVINLLPVLAKFIKDWGGEQEIGSPDINIPSTMALSSGAVTNATFEVRNGSKGVWRGFRSTATTSLGSHTQDEQYKYILKDLTVKTWSVTAVNEKGLPTGWTANTTPLVTITAFDDMTLNYGEAAKTITYSVSGVPTYGAMAVFEMTYDVIGDDGTTVMGSNLKEQFHTWLNYNGSNANTSFTPSSGSDHLEIEVRSPQYVGLNAATSVIPNLVMGDVVRVDGGGSVKDQRVEIFATTTNPIHGITWGAFDFTISRFCHTQNDPTSVPKGGSWSLTPFKAVPTINMLWSASTKGLFGTNFNQVTGYASINGAFDAAAWKAKVDDGTLYPGASTSWTVSLEEHEKGASTTTVSIIYYDDTYLSKLQDLVNDELGKNVSEETYNVTGTVNAKELFVSADDATTPDENEKETNFADTTTVDGNKVTVINRATAWATYQKALKDAFRGARQEWNTDSVYNHEELYHNLRIAANDMAQCKKTADEMSGVATNDSAVLALETKLDGIEATWSDSKDYTDYLMHRWNRYNDVRENARDIVNAYEATLRTEADLTTYFPYTWVYPSEVSTMVAGDQYADFITALFEDFDEEEIEAKRAEFENAQAHYRSIKALDIANASALLDKIPGRLITRPTAVYDQFLADEIESAKAMIDNDNKDANNKQIYTDRSWNKYSAALETAEKVLAGTYAENPKTQMTVFDTKYELLTCRNELVKLDEEADYSELEALIDQATYALANSNLYDNTNEDFGKVLAELGYKTFKDSNGNNVDLFPGSAIYTNNEPYTTEDQDIIDSAARDLKEALARLKFKGVTVPGTSNEVIVEGNEEEGIEEVTASVATIAALQNAETVKGLFNELNGATITAKIVTEDINYSVGCDYVKEIEAFVGTNATITFYSTTAEGIEIPVATVKLVVEADVNGDGVIDVLDAAIAQLTSTEHAELTGCYYLAANLDTAADAINDADYQAIVTEVLAA